jgi:hypothetical protein
MAESRFSITAPTANVALATGCSIDLMNFPGRRKEKEA